MTWWMLVGSVYGKCDNNDIPVPNLMPLYLMRKYHGNALKELGDELTLHYHTFLWSDYNHDGVYYWNEAQNFHVCREDWDQALAQSLIEEEMFPVSFRSGWHYMDNEWQGVLNELLPYNMDDDSPNIGFWYTFQEPIFNVLDWSKAPTNFIPYQPSSTNYQVAGDGVGWNVRSVKFPNVTQKMVNGIFAEATNGVDQVVSFWGHLGETDFLTNIAKIDAFIRVALTNYPDVPFRYCTAVEAMQRWRGITDVTPPQLEVTQETNGETIILTLRTDEPIFQKQPFVALKDIFQHYQIVPCESTGSNEWKSTLGVPINQIAKLGLAVTDPAGNLTTRIVRFIPDDVFVDNLDAEYSDAAGNWSSGTAKSSWGTDIRLAILNSNETAQARWTLPVTESRPYNLLVQVPFTTNAASNIVFNVYAGTNLQTLSFSEPLPPNQWIYLATPYLDATTSNSLEMIVSANGTTNATVAIADVVKLSPLPQPLPGFITDVAVDPSAATANITWNTPEPATSLILYGRTTTYGAFSTTNSQRSFSHVATLNDLKPDTRYYFEIDSNTELPYSFSGTFKTTTLVSPTNSMLIFDVPHRWRYSTNNFDFKTEWKNPDFDDSDWPRGAGLLWVDTRAGKLDPSVEPRNTELPYNLKTKYPYFTYYFRTRFTLTNNLDNAALVFTNYIDDGAVFYLNGIEIWRNNMQGQPTPIWNASVSSEYNCNGDANCPTVFVLKGSALTNLISGSNLLAVEVHNYSYYSTDITFGMSLSFNQLATPAPTIRFMREGENVILYWNNSDAVLQRTEHLIPAEWIDVPGPVTTSPYLMPDVDPGFFRLRE